MARRQRRCPSCARLAHGLVVGEAEVERRALGDRPPRRRDDVIAPGRAPALLDRVAAGAARRSPARPCAARCRARRGPAGAGRRRPAAGRSRPARDPACRGRSSAQAPGASTMRALLSSGSRCRVALSISASRSGRRRSVSPAMATGQRGVGRRQAFARLRGRVQRLAAAQHGIEHLQRGAPRRQAFNAWHRPLLTHHLRGMKRPKHLKAPAYLSHVAARAQAGAGRGRPPPDGEEEQGSIPRATATGRRRASRSISSAPPGRGGRASSSCKHLRRRPALPDSKSVDRGDDRHVDAASPRRAVRAPAR